MCNLKLDDDGTSYRGLIYPPYPDAGCTTQGRRRWLDVSFFLLGDKLFQALSMLEDIENAVANPSQVLFDLFSPQPVDPEWSMTADRDQRALNLEAGIIEAKLPQPNVSQRNSNSLFVRRSPYNVLWILTITDVSIELYERLVTIGVSYFLNKLFFHLKKKC